MTQADHEAYDQELEQIDLKNMVETIANDYAAMYNSAPNPNLKDVFKINFLCFGEGEGVLVATAIKQLWEVNEEYKEGK